MSVSILDRLLDETVAVIRDLVTDGRLEGATTLNVRKRKVSAAHDDLADLDGDPLVIVAPGLTPRQVLPLDQHGNQEVLTEVEVVVAAQDRAALKAVDIDRLATWVETLEVAFGRPVPIANVAALFDTEVRPLAWDQATLERSRVIAGVSLFYHTTRGR